jgi:hypothetical protein
MQEINAWTRGLRVSAYAAKRADHCAEAFMRMRPAEDSPIDQPSIKSLGALGMK